MTTTVSIEADKNAIQKFGKCLKCEYAYLTLGKDDLDEYTVRLACDHSDMDTNPTPEDVQKCSNGC